MSATNGLILKLALQAMDDEAALPVLGDAIIEAEWFDERVMQVMEPCRRLRKTRQRRRDRESFFAGRPERFQVLVARPTRAFATAVAAVLLFGEWSHLRWVRPRPVLYSNARVFLNGVELAEVANVRYEAGTTEPVLWGERIAGASTITISSRFSNLFKSDRYNTRT